MTFWSVVGAGLVAVAILAAIALILAKPLCQSLMRMALPAIGGLMREEMERLRTGYQKNPLGLLPVAEKVSVLGLLEVAMRAETGKAPSRPLGSPIRFSPWDDLLLPFANMQPMPKRESESVSLAATIGPAAAKPLALSLPVLIAPMSYGGALSLRARVALAKASATVGTATNSGEGVFIDEERQAAKHYIIQYHRGTWPTSPQNDWKVFDRADAIEIQLSQGAQGAAPMKDLPKSIHPEMRRRFGLKEDECAVIDGRLQGVDRPEELISLVRDLKDRFPVPVGVKFGATAQMEEEMAVYLEAGVDFLTIDGAEGGTHGGPPILQDAMGLPLVWGIARARAFLEKHGKEKSVSLLATGGLIEPGDFLKAIALGATACYSGSAVIFSLLSDQVNKAMMDMAPPYALALQSTAYLHDELDGERAAANVVKLFKAWEEEWQLAMRAMGKESLQDLARDDLVARTLELASMLGVRHVAGPLMEERRLPESGKGVPAARRLVPVP